MYVQHENKKKTILALYSIILYYYPLTPGRCIVSHEQLGFSCLIKLLQLQQGLLAVVATHTHAHTDTDTDTHTHTSELYFLV